MIGVILVLVFIATFSLVYTIASGEKTNIRPRLQPLLNREDMVDAEKNRKPTIFRHIAIINKPLCIGPLGRRIYRDLSVGRVDWTPEEFFLVKEIFMVAILLLTFPYVKPDILFFWGSMSFCGGYLLPEIWLRKKVKFAKNSVIKELPDTIDLLALCVNAGLDFMLALKWVVEKSKKSILVDELSLVMQEINVGKPRRTALYDLSKKYDLPDLSTFTRTLIQADRMGTSVAEALNILSEDMRLARFRRGEQIALKAPMKMLVPLLFFIFPVVGILVAAPVFLDFMNNNPLQNIGQTTGNSGAPR